MDQHSELEIEQKCMKLFENLEWDVRLATDSFHGDFLLYHDGIPYGFVECISRKSVLDTQYLKNKIERIQNVLETEKPPIFVLTNGNSFDVYYEGEYATTLTVPPSPEVISRYKRLLAYYKKYMELTKKDN